MKERILHAAILLMDDEKHFLVGKCHADCYYQGKNMNIATSSRAAAQGFVTSLGRYVDRYEAAKIACSAGQVKDITVLISEDLWRDGGFSYDSVKGYFKPTEGDEVQSR